MWINRHQQSASGRNRSEDRYNAPSALASPLSPTHQWKTITADRCRLVCARTVIPQARFQVSGSGLLAERTSGPESPGKPSRRSAAPQPLPAHPLEPTTFTNTPTRARGRQRQAWKTSVRSDLTDAPSPYTPTSHPSTIIAPHQHPHPQSDRGFIWARFGRCGLGSVRPSYTIGKPIRRIDAVSSAHAPLWGPRRFCRAIPYPNPGLPITKLFGILRRI